MKSRTNLTITLAALWLSNLTALAQGTTNTNTSAQTVFPVRFAATCQAFDSTRGRLVTTRVTERTIIAEALGVRPNDRNSLSNFSLAYNAAADSLQVVDANLQPVVDVIHFGGGAATADNRQLTRFTFLFFPGQTNEFGAETNVFGSAVITESTNRSSRAANGVPNITGRLQYFLSGGNVLGMTNTFGNSSSVSNNLSGTQGSGTVGTGTTNKGTASTSLLSTGSFAMTSSNIVFDSSAQICIATFTTGRGVGLVQTITSPGANTNATTGMGTNGSGTTTTTTTNTPNTTGSVTNAGTSGTGATGTGTTTGATTGAGTGGVVGVNTGTGTTINAVNSSTANLGFGSVGSTPGVSGIAGTTGVGAAGTGSTLSPALPVLGVNTGTGTLGSGTVGVVPGTTISTTGGTLVGSGTVGLGTTTGTALGTAGTLGSTTTAGMLGVPITTGF